MTSALAAPVKITVTRERWPLVAPFRISGYSFATTNTLTVSLESGGQIGRGEASGVYYRNDGIEQMLEQIESVRGAIEAGIDRSRLQALLPGGGARNALDCALWDLEAKLKDRTVSQIAGLGQPRSLVTTFTCGADEPAAMAAAALRYKDARAIKLKLTGEPLDVERVLQVRRACPRVWLGVDANQGFTRAFPEQIMPALCEARVELIEQPFPMDQDSHLDGLKSPIPIAADESVQGIADLPRLVGRYSVVNIKLDKCGGLTEGLAIARAAKELGLESMIGNMTGTSLAMAPAFVVGRLCRIVDLDGPTFLKRDRETPVRYVRGRIIVPTGLWGSRVSI
ncbi:MAG TPA: dipeptide epimerase [Steroidobacteraceae bacterium]|nr:dipeptide epimerase [Steroidobacteraceae bacterium]